MDQRTLDSNCDLLVRRAPIYFRWNHCGPITDDFSRELGETGPTETQPIWQARIERASKFAGPLLGAYVTVEMAKRFVEQWLGYAPRPFPCLLVSGAKREIGNLLLQIPVARALVRGVHSLRGFPIGALENNGARRYRAGAEDRAWFRNAGELPASKRPQGGA